MFKNPIPYGRQEITEADIEAVITTLKSDFLTQGPRIKEFEDKFATYIGCRYAVAVANGTAALHLSAMALGVNSKSRVITTPITFAASANCILYCGGSVEFVDIDPVSFTIDIDKLEGLLKQYPKGYYQGIVPVDFAGYPVDTERLRKIADEYGLWILEDACHAPGGYFYNAKKEKTNCGDGRYSDLSIFSFHPVKHIASGEGGMITTNDEALYKRLLNIRTHGINKNFSAPPEGQGGWYYEMTELGYNYRLPDILCSLGITQLARAESNLIKRRKIADIYSAALTGLAPGIKIPQYPAGHAFHLYVIRTEKRLALYDFLHSRNIFTQVHYIPVHTLPYYQGLGFKKGSMPEAEKYYEECLSLPMYPSITKEEHEYVIACIMEFFS